MAKSKPDLSHISPSLRSLAVPIDALISLQAVLLRQISIVITEAIEALPCKNARYIGLRLEKANGASADNADAEMGIELDGAIVREYPARRSLALV